MYPVSYAHVQVRTVDVEDIIDKMEALEATADSAGVGAGVVQRHKDNTNKLADAKLKLASSTRNKGVTEEQIAEIKVWRLTMLESRF